MVRVEHSFTLDDLKEFGQAKYSGFTSKSKARENAYPRQIAAYVAVEAGYGYSQIGRTLNVTHATIIWSKQRAFDHLMVKNEMFTKMYAEFVENFNTFLSNKFVSNELPAAVNEGESVNA